VKVNKEKMVRFIFWVTFFSSIIGPAMALYYFMVNKYIDSDFALFFSLAYFYVHAFLFNKLIRMGPRALDSLDDILKNTQR